MPLKVVLETLDGIDDAVKPFYTETEGKFVLAVEGVDSHPEVANLKSAFERVKASDATARSDLQKAKDAAKKAADDLAAALKTRPDEAALQKMRADLEAERDEWRGKAETSEKRLLGVTRDRQLQDALAGAGVSNPAFLKAAMRLHQDAVKVADGEKAVVETDMGPMPVADFIKKWAAGEGKDFVTPAKGGGAQGNDKGTTGGKTISRADFDKMDPAARVAAMTGGATLTD